MECMCVDVKFCSETVRDMRTKLFVIIAVNVILLSSSKRQRWHANGMRRVAPYIVHLSSRIANERARIGYTSPNEQKERGYRKALVSLSCLLT